ncbi:MAG: 16S rRNA (guanine(966)-N(2))-methyltransferase RsmD [Gammaproteobacteria bacterium]|nr:16S rRNA (guanine(966)-N(2))-methyltransferase RsmD [Gammaproteobacteria bacterium]
MVRRIGGKQGAKGPSASGTGSLRIIAGVWRGRRISFADAPGLRPTPDRVRETLFNWLQALASAEDCLDLYAGSGACGVEALSRGARSVTFVDAARVATDTIRQHLATLETAPGFEGRYQLVNARAEQWLATQSAARDGAAFGLVFLDPPFADNVLVAQCHALEQSGLLKPVSHIYVESGDPLPAPGITEQFPENWQLIKSGRAGAVHFGLYRREAP